MARIFISYRRSDSADVAEVLYQQLIAVFGKESVFKDVDFIPVGEDFRAVIERELINCEVMLVLIGPTWLTVTDSEGRRRLDNPEDFVRIEVEIGLRHRQIRVIPVFVKGAGMPREDELPSRIDHLVFQNGAVLSDDNFERDIQRLIRKIAPESTTDESATHEPASPQSRRISRTLGVVAIAALLLALIFVFLLLRDNFTSTTQPTFDPELEAQRLFTQTAIAQLNTVNPPTDTPDATLTIEAIIARYLTETDVAQATAVANQTAVAAAWTATPTSTFTPTETYTLSPTLTDTPVSPTPTVDLTSTELVNVANTQIAARNETSTAAAQFQTSTSVQQTQNAQATLSVPTDTPQPTDTQTSTHTYTYTPTITPTDTFTPLPTDTPQPTSTPTYTYTETFTATATFTPTPNKTQTIIAQTQVQATLLQAAQNEQATLNAIATSIRQTEIALTPTNTSTYTATPTFTETYTFTPVTPSATPTDIPNVTSITGFVPITASNGSDLELVNILLGGCGEFSPDGTLLAVSESGLYEVATGTRRFTTERFYPHFSPDGTLLAVGTQGVYEVATGTRRFPIQGWDPQFSPDGLLLVAGEDGVYEVATGIRRFTTGGWGVFSPDGTLLAVGGDGVYEVATGTRRFFIGGGGIFSPDGALLAVGGDGVYEVATGTRRFQISDTATFSPDGTLLLVSGDGIYEVATGTRRFAINGDWGVFSPDGTLLLVRGDGVYEVATGTRRFAINGDWGIFNPDGTLLAVSNDAVYDVTTGSVLSMIEGFPMAFNADSSFLTVYMDMGVSTPSAWVCGLYAVRNQSLPYHTGRIRANQGVNIRSAPRADAQIVRSGQFSLALVFARTADNAWFRVGDDMWVSASVVEIIDMPEDVPIEDSASSNSSSISISDTGPRVPVIVSASVEGTCDSFRYVVSWRDPNGDANRLVDSFSNQFTVPISGSEGTWVSDWLSCSLNRCQAVFQVVDDEGRRSQGVRAQVNC